MNTLGPYLCTRAVVPGMTERGDGRIVNIGSGGSYLPVTNATISSDAAYGPSKAALGRFSELIAAMLSPLGIVVFLISPGLVRTAMTERMGDDAPWTPRSSRRGSSGCSHRVAPMRWPADTCTPSTTTSRI